MSRRGIRRGYIPPQGLTESYGIDPIQGIRRPYYRPGEGAAPPPPPPGIISPNTIGTSTTVEAVRSGCRRLLFKHGSYFFVCYSDGTNEVYRTSLDGTSWGAATNIRANTASYAMAMWYDGTYVYYAYVLYGSGNNPKFRRGSISGATITWGTEVNAAVATNYGEIPNLITDSGGYPWFMYRSDSSNGVIVAKSSTNDGTWANPGGFPVTLTAYQNAHVGLVPLTTQRVYAMYGKAANGKIYGKLWGGASWGSEEDASSSNHVSSDEAHNACAVNEGDNIHLVFLKVTTYDIVYRKYTYGVGWGSEATVQAGTTATSGVSLAIDDATGTLYCFWAGSPTADHVYYKKCVGGTWDANPTDLSNEATDHLAANSRLNAFYKAYGSWIGLEYMTKTGSPWNIRFCALPV